MQGFFIFVVLCDFRQTTSRTGKAFTGGHKGKTLNPVAAISLTQAELYRLMVP
jgi:hypothetical protein